MKYEQNIKYIINQITCDILRVSSFGLNIRYSHTHKHTKLECITKSTFLGILAASLFICIADPYKYVCIHIVRSCSTSAGSIETIYTYKTYYNLEVVWIKQRSEYTESTVLRYYFEYCSRKCFSIFIDLYKLTARYVRTINYIFRTQHTKSTVCWFNLIYTHLYWKGADWKFMRWRMSKRTLKR